MKEEMYVLMMVSIGTLLGYVAGTSTTEEKLEEQAITYEKRLATKELQITLLQTGYEECRSIVTKLKPIIEPRPLK